jgi:hypothetical protein
MGNNEYTHRIFTQKSEADKALNTLKGILAGIVIDDVDLFPKNRTVLN